MTETQSTSKTHEFVASGCVNQWAADHDDADCMRAYKESSVHWVAETSRACCPVCGGFNPGDSSHVRCM